MDEGMSRVGRRIFELRRALGLNQGAFAKVVGVEQATVSRWESDKQIPEAPALVKMAKMANQSVEDFLGQVEITTAFTVNIPVIGAVQAGAWVEAVEWPPDKQYSVTVIYRQELAGKRRFALEVRGPSMNRLYPPGTILDCVSTYDVASPLGSGQRVIVERVRADGAREASCKEYVVDQEGRTWLWPRSDDPEHQQPLRYLPDSDRRNGVESIEITALVVGSYRPE
jgi:transcriptional regulator with XRE-family HTH domain